MLGIRQENLERCDANKTILSVIVNTENEEKNGMMEEINNVHNSNVKLIRSGKKGNAFMERIEAESEVFDDTWARVGGSTHNEGTPSKAPLAKKIAPAKLKTTGLPAAAQSKRLALSIFLPSPLCFVPRHHS
ncbi:MAG: hypothetical protein SGARI_004495 [Bacillariaceae sp.]